MEVKLRVTDMAGEEIGTLENARLTRARWTLNRPEQFDFSLDPFDPKWSIVPTDPTDEHQVQLWIDGVLRGWGPVVRRDRSRVQCEGLLWFFDNRFLGPVYSFMDAYNGSFEVGSVGGIPAGWVDGGLDNRGISADIGLHGNRSFVAGVAASPPQDKFVSVTFGSDRPYPYNVEVVVWYHIGWNTGYGSTFEGRGLYVVQWDHGTSTVEQEVNGPLQLSLEPLGVWRRTSVSLTVPAGDKDIEVRLYGADACTLNYDLLDIVLEQRTHSLEGEDASVLIRRLVDYCVGNDYGGGPDNRDSDYVLKSDLVVLWDPTNSASLGRVGARSYRHADGASFGTCLAEFAARNVCDYEITYDTEGTVRYFTVWGPRKGVFRPWSFTLLAPGQFADAAGSIVDFDDVRDGRRVATLVRARGRGTGGAESGVASTSTGVQVEAFAPVTNDEDPNALNASAAAELAVRSTGTRVPWIDVAGAGSLLAQGLTTGDTIPIRILYGSTDIDATLRVVAMELTEERGPDSDIIRLYLNVP